MNQILKIAITGPESTGKSSLAKSLANYFKTTWVPEYARSYLSELDRPYEQYDLPKIAAGQIASEEESLKNAHKFLFCDTEMIVMKIWSIHKYGKTDQQILDLLAQNNYDLYLLMNVDLEWKHDVLRENPGKGLYFFKWFKKELKDKNAIYEVVSGNKEQRIESAINALKNHFDI